MDPASIALIAALVVLLLLSSFFSASETSFSSLNRVRLKSMAAGGNKKAQRTLDLSEKYDKLLSSVLIGNNIVNILASSLATVLFVGWFGDLGVTLSTIVVTVLVLTFGEITPKTLAKESPESFAMFATAPLRAIMVVLTPLNAFFSAWKKLLFKLFKLGKKQSISEQELLTYVEEVRQDGTISEAEEDLIRSVIEFDDLRAIDIYTPRVDITAVGIDDDADEIAAVFYETGYSRLPVYRGNIDGIVGVLLEKDFHYYVKQLHQTVEQTMRPALFVTKNAKISSLLDELRQKKLHMAVLLDEYGGTIGIVTIEDIVEELVGEIWDEHDDIVDEMCETAKGRWLVHGGMPLDDMLDRLGLRAETAAQTAGGWVLEQLGHIPAKGEQFDFEGLHVQVEEMRRNRVYTITVEDKRA